MCSSAAPIQSSGVVSASGARHRSPCQWQIQRLSPLHSLGRQGHPGRRPFSNALKQLIRMIKGRAPPAVHAPATLHDCASVLAKAEHSILSPTHRVSLSQDTTCFALTLDRCRTTNRAQESVPDVGASIGIRAEGRRSPCCGDRATPARAAANTEERGTASGDEDHRRSIEHGDPNGQCSGT